MFYWGGAGGGFNLLKLLKANSFELSTYYLVSSEHLAAPPQLNNAPEHRGTPRGFRNNLAERDGGNEGTGSVACPERTERTSAGLPVIAAMWRTESVRLTGGRGYLKGTSRPGYFLTVSSGVSSGANHPPRHDHSLSLLTHSLTRSTTTLSLTLRPLTHSSPPSHPPSHPPSLIH